MSVKGAQRVALVIFGGLWVCYFIATLPALRRFEKSNTVQKQASEVAQIAAVSPLVKRAGRDAAERTSNSIVALNSVDVEDNDKFKDENHQMQQQQHGERLDLVPEGGQTKNDDEVWFTADETVRMRMLESQKKHPEEKRVLLTTSNPADASYGGNAHDSKVAANANTDTEGMGESSVGTQIRTEENPLSKYSSHTWHDRYLSKSAQITLESLIGHRCLDRPSSKVLTGLVWNCKTQKGSWLEANNQVFTWSPLSESTKQIYVAPIDPAATVMISTYYHNRNLCLQASGEMSSKLLVVDYDVCESTRSEQQWHFYPSTGRHKNYGLLQNAASGLCLARKHDNLLEVVATKCRFAESRPQGHIKYHEDCTQLWAPTLLNSSRFLNRVEAESRIVGPKLPQRSVSLVPNAGRILCWILTYPKTHENRAVAVNRTWGQHCDILLFMTTEEFPSLPVVKLDLGGPEGRDMIWTKTKLSWMHVYEKYRSMADWFIKADDDTYIVWDNLHKFLSKHDTNEPRFFGRRLIPGGTRLDQAYYSGGSGIIFSKATLIKLGEAAGNSKSSPVWATPVGGPEDRLTAATLAKLNISAENCVDTDGKELFFPMGTGSEQRAKERKESMWFYKMCPDVVAGPDCCSKKWVASHYHTPEDLLRMDDLEYASCADTFASEWPHFQLGNN